MSMTVKELCDRLQELVNEGHGDKTVFMDPNVQIDTYETLNDEGEFVIQSVDYTCSWIVHGVNVVTNRKRISKHKYREEVVKVEVY